MLSGEEYFLEIPTTRGSPGVFPAGDEDSMNQGGDKEKISIRDRSIKEVVGKPNLGPDAPFP